MEPHCQLRSPRQDELPALSALCLRSKAWWGYDAAFMAACRDELTLTSEDLEAGSLVLAEAAGTIVGVAQVSLDAGDAQLEKLFVDPEQIGSGAGRLLWNWAVGEARRLGAVELIIEADPGAEPFYRHMGCTLAGDAPSGSIPGRRLPRLIYPL